jgi:hypothetical protein
MSYYRPEALILTFARQSRWRVVGQDADCYRFVADDPARCWQPVAVRYRDDAPSVLFQSWLPVRFPLERPLSGHYPRLLLRNFGLSYGSWAMEIAESCEACLCVAARLPRASLDAALFGAVCRELAGEVARFHQELRDAFRGVEAAEGYRPSPADMPGQRLPLGQGAEIRYLD